MQPLGGFATEDVTAPLSATYGSERNSKHLWKSVENLDDSHATGMVQSSN
jgi:hypothetical protein